MTEFYLGSIKNDIVSKEAMSDISNYDFMFKLKVYSKNELQIVDILYQKKDFKSVNNLIIGSFLKFDDISINKNLNPNDLCNSLTKNYQIPVYRSTVYEEYMELTNDLLTYFDDEKSYLYFVPSLNYLAKEIINKNKILKETDIIKIIGNESKNYNKIQNIILELEKMQDMLKSDVVFCYTF